MKRFLRAFRKAADGDCVYCQELLDGQLRIPAIDLMRGLLCCPACRSLYQTISPSDRSDPRIDLIHVRLSGDSQVNHTFDPKSEAMSRQLRAEEGFHKGGWFSGPSYPPAASYPPVERAVELYYLRGKQAPPWPTINAARHIAATADSPECLGLIRTWVADCDKRHRGCKKNASDLLPDRVIFVGGGADPHLVESAGQRGKYIALSHRWGGAVELQLKQDTIDDFKQGIPFARFPKTFQDAILICRALSIDYIWIDSICIIQDKKEDWEIQGSKMDQVYASSFLTLAADAAVNSQSGFIRTSERQELYTGTRKMDCHRPQGKPSEVFIRPWRDFGTLGGFGRHYQSLGADELELSQRLADQGSYLLQRGWVLQETFLPRRLLHFLPGEVTWRCSSISRCECQIQPHDRVVHQPLDRELPREIDSENLKEYWKEIVEQYTRRQLTYSSDRLVALAGCASRAHSLHPKVHYYAGLWSDDLPATLLWTVARPVESGQLGAYESRRIVPAIAPTWSWANVTGHVDFLFWKRNFGRGEWMKDALNLHIIHVHYPPPSVNKYGSVSDAKLIVEGYLCQVLVFLKGGSSWHFPFRMDATNPDGTVTKASGLLYPDTDEVLATLQDTNEHGVPVVMVGIYGSRHFLLLRQIYENQSVYERIGACHLHSSDGAILAEWRRKERFTIV